LIGLTNEVDKQYIKVLSSIGASGDKNTQLMVYDARSKVRFVLLSLFFFFFFFFFIERLNYRWLQWEIEELVVDLRIIVQRKYAF
jgi:hypothetical protein